jgi:hypothetical protein
LENRGKRIGEDLGDHDGGIIRAVPEGGV